MSFKKHRKNNVLLYSHFYFILIDKLKKLSLYYIHVIISFFFFFFIVKKKRKKNSTLSLRKVRNLSPRVLRILVQTLHFIAFNNVHITRPSILRHIHPQQFSVLPYAPPHATLVCPKFVHVHWSSSVKKKEENKLHTTLSTHPTAVYLRLYLSAFSPYCPVPYCFVPSHSHIS